MPSSGRPGSELSGERLILALFVLLAIGTAVALLIFSSAVASRFRPRVYAALAGDLMIPVAAWFILRAIGRRRRNASGFSPWATTATALVAILIVVGLVLLGISPPKPTARAGVAQLAGGKPFVLALDLAAGDQVSWNWNGTAPANFTFAFIAPSGPVVLRNAPLAAEGWDNLTVTSNGPYELRWVAMDPGTVSYRVETSGAFAV